MPVIGVPRFLVQYRLRSRTGQGCLNSPGWAGWWPERGARQAHSCSRPRSPSPRRGSRRCWQAHRCSRPRSAGNLGKLLLSVTLAARRRRPAILETSGLQLVRLAGDSEKLTSRSSHLYSLLQFTTIPLEFPLNG